MGLSISLSRATQYPTPRARENYNTANLLNQSEKTEYNGIISDATKKKIHTLVGNLHAALYDTQKDRIKVQAPKTKQETTKNQESRIIREGQQNIQKTFRKKELIFLTLTLPVKQAHRDNQIKRTCLNGFIISMIRQCQIINWLWVAELQSNGNIHFHLILDNVIPFIVVDNNGTIIYSGSPKQCEQYTKKHPEKKHLIESLANREWNKQLIKLGYIAQFKKRYKHENPPSTRVEKIQNGKSIRQYITKYITKKENKDTVKNRKIEGRLWGCSDSLKEYSNIPITGETANEFVKILAKRAKIVYQNDYVTCWEYTKESVLEVYKKASTIFRSILNDHYELE